MTDSKETLQLLVIELALKLAEECCRLNLSVSCRLPDGTWKRDGMYIVRASPESGVALIETSPNFLPERFDLTRRPDQQEGQPAESARFPAGLLRELALALPRLMNEIREKASRIEAENRDAIENAIEALKEKP